MASPYFGFLAGDTSLSDDLLAAGCGEAIGEDEPSPRTSSRLVFTFMSTSSSARNQRGVKCRAY